MGKLQIAQEVLKCFNDNGYEAYIVGGYVRDYLAGIESNDIDITTSATPDVVSKLFKSYPTGIKYGTVTISYKDNMFEVTTFRSDISYTDNRHPIINYGVTLFEDLSRRDFTINGMAMDINLQITDLYEGKKDLENKIIRTINDPDKRFNEDALRMLRAIYFVSKLGFSIDEKTIDAIKRNKHLLKKISIERIYHEIKKIVCGKYQNEAFKYFIETGLALYIPGLYQGIKYAYEKKIVLTLDELFVLSYKLEENDLTVWKLSSNDSKRISLAVDLANVCEDGNYSKIILYTYTLPICLLANRINYYLGLNNDLSSRLHKMDQDLPIHKTCDLKFKGQDIMKLTSRKEASWLGEIIDEVKFMVINGKIKNDYDEIKAYVVEMLRKENVDNEK